MKIVFPLDSKHKIGYVFIGHNGKIRFNKEFGRLFNLQQGEKWNIGYDEECANKEFMYFFKTDNEDGVTMELQHSSFILSAKRFTDLFEVTPHAYYEYEKISFEGRKGFRVKIVANPLLPKKYSRKSENINV